MKKTYILLLLTSFCSFSQFNSSAPWNINNESAKSGEMTINEEVTLFNQYWSNKDKNVKGSGHKPFMRWENYWRNNTNDQGYLITPQEINNAFQQKQQAKLNKSATSLPPSNWQPVGPFTHTNSGSWSSGQGRVNVVYVDPSNANTMYIGTPAGGIWKSVDAGVNWLPLSDDLPQIGVSGIVVDHTNSNVIYIATGDKDAGDTYSVGVMKSTDGGATWNTTGLSFLNTSTRAGDIIMHPTNNQILLCATSQGIFKTTDAGVTWTNVQSGNFAQGSIRFNTLLINNIYAVSNNRFYKSTDTGSTFTSTATGLPPPTTSNPTRMIMEITPANYRYIYILAYSSNKTTLNGLVGLYRSIDGGDSFELKSDTNTASPTDFLESRQGYYDLALGVSPTNAQVVYTGCLNLWKSTTGGGAFTKINDWNQPTTNQYTHADIHYLGFHGNKLFCGSDGGVYVSTDNAASFTDLTASAQISQFYRVSVSKQTSANMVGGLQDNGGHAYSNGLWKNYYGADGMDTGVDPTNQNLYYGFIQYGGGLYGSTNAGNSRNIYVGAPSAETGANDDGGNWITPLKINSIGEVFAGYGNLYKLSGSSWVQQSNAAIGTGDIEYIEVAPSNDNIMYVANGNQLYKSSNKGVANSLSYTASSAITSIEAHHSDVNIVYITTSGTGGEVLKSTDGGTNFTSISTGLPNIAKNIIIHQGQNSDNPLYVGTSLGVYYRDDSMAQWEPFDTNLPNVSVRDLEINLIDSKLIAATYGRGIWQTDIPQDPLSSESFKLTNISIYPNPSRGLFTIALGDVQPNLIEVYDITGKVILSRTNNSITNFETSLDLSSASQGVYFVKIGSDTGTTTKKIIKK
ncbi:MULTISPECIES: T9SS type A sorting domain-containing protein [Flavobacterium]|uniref:T9SS type A sorting domain-containing protein n=2 Tax=Flavobacterium jumunjinense TaxID=998845 RepID=A0ABV5GSQ3_9FLAO|nr:T9SS type A sorting domain-containing protein [Flavobacterium sp. N1861]